MDELLGHVCRQFVAVALRDEVQHHINRSGTSCAGECLAVNFKQFV